MKRLCLLFSVLLALFVAGSAAAQDVRFNFDKEADFTKFKTYKWVPIQGATQVNELLDGQIKAAIDAELAKKGLSRVEADNADLLIGYQAAVTQEKEFTSYSSGWGAGPGFYRGGWYGAGGMTTTTGSTSTIYIGSIGVDMYEAAKKSLAWRGMVSKTIDQNAKPDKQQKNLAKAMEKLFKKNYPPPVKK
jgi:hypothetical protein